jgi:hypothetical protein
MPEEKEGFEMMRGPRQIVATMVSLGLLLIAAVGRGDAAGYTYKAVAYLEAAAPGGGKFVDNFQAGAISEKGELAFISAYPADDSEGLYLATEQGIVAILQPGRAATDGWTFSGGGPIGQIIGPVSMNAIGDIAFGSDIKKGDTISSGNFIWRRSTDSFTKVNLPGEEAPGGGQFGDVPGQAWASLNDRGDVLFEARVPNPSGELELGLFLRSADGKLSSIVRPGDKSPEGGVFSLPRRARGTLNATGQIAFRANVTLDGDTWTGVYLFQDGKITPLATPAIDAPGGGKFSEAHDPRINNRGQVAFNGETSSGWGVFLWENNTIRPVAAPGVDLPGGATLDAPATTECGLAINQSGAVAMLLMLTDGSMGVYSFHDGAVEAVVQPGMTLPGIGEVETTGHCVAIGNLGHVGLEAHLKDGKVALVLATPAP